jgi:nucleotide-binding universal stress UspA family protein
VEIEKAHVQLLDGVEEKIKRSAIDMIVMGSHGASGKEEYFIGSNAQKMVRKMHVPILVIKNPLKDIEFKTAVFATSLLDSEKKCFLRFKELIAPFGVEKIHLVAIDLEGYFHQPTRVMTEALKNFKKLVSPYKGETHFFRDYSVEAGVRHLSMEIMPDIIGISNHERRPLKRMLQGSNVEMLANHVDLPLLCIDFPSSINEID